MVAGTSLVIPADRDASEGGILMSTRQTPPGLRTSRLVFMVILFGAPILLFLILIVAGQISALGGQPRGWGPGGKEVSVTWDIWDSQSRYDADAPFAFVGGELMAVRTQGSDLNWQEVQFDSPIPMSLERRNTSGEVVHTPWVHYLNARCAARDGSTLYLLDRLGAVDPNSTDATVPMRLYNLDWESLQPRATPETLPFPNRPGVEALLQSRFGQPLSGGQNDRLDRLRYNEQTLWAQVLPRTPKDINGGRGICQVGVMDQEGQAPEWLFWIPLPVSEDHLGSWISDPALVQIDDTHFEIGLCRTHYDLSGAEASSDIAMAKFPVPPEVTDLEGAYND